MANLIIGNKTNQSGYTLLLDANLKTTNENNQEIDLVELIPAWARAAQKPSYTASEVGAVPTSRTVNGKALSSNITLTAANVGAVPTSRTINDQSLNANIVLDAADVGAVPTTRTVNGQSLNSDVTLNATNIPATTPQGLSGENTQELLTEIAAKLNQGIQYDILKSAYPVSGTNTYAIDWQDYDVLVFGVQQYQNRLDSIVMSTAWFRTTNSGMRPYSQAHTLNNNSQINYQIYQNGEGSITVIHSGANPGNQYGFYLDGIKF